MGYFDHLRKLPPWGLRNTALTARPAAQLHLNNIMVAKNATWELAPTEVPGAAEAKGARLAETAISRPS